MPYPHPAPTKPLENGNFCGGIAGISCPTGYTCQLDGNYPDAGGTCVKYNNTPTKPRDETVCTQDAKLCPNGSYVSRGGPNCEFSKCPGAR